MKKTIKKSVTLEIKMAKIEEGMKNFGEKLDNHIVDNKVSASEQRESSLRLEKKFDDFICGCNDKFADKEQFIFWRNLLISGIVVTILLGMLVK